MSKKSLKKRVKELEKQVRVLELITGLRGHTTQTMEGDTVIYTIRDDETGETKEMKFSVNS